MDGLAKKQITDEVVASVNSAQSPQELNALKEKINQKITNPELRDDLLSKVDAGYERFRQNQGGETVKADSPESETVAADNNAVTGAQSTNRQKQSAGRYRTLVEEAIYQQRKKTATAAGLGVGGVTAGSTLMNGNNVQQVAAAGTPTLDSFNGVLNEDIYNAIYAEVYNTARSTTNPQELAILAQKIEQNIKVEHFKNELLAIVNAQ